LLTERLRRLVLGGPIAPPSPASGESPATRHSHGLEQFTASLEQEQGLFVLDLEAVTQENVSFLTDLGHRVYSEDILTLADNALGEWKEKSVEEPGPSEVEAFLRHSLDFPEAHFDGVLMWETLEFLPPPLLKPIVDRLFRITKPGSLLLAFFRADERAASLPVLTYRIADAATLHLALREARHPAQRLNNRAIEKLFERFHSVKFFLTRGNLREVIVRR